MSNSDHVDLYPLRFAPLPKEKVWGGTRMAALFPDRLPAGRPIGELWVVWEQLAVENGAWRGRTLAELIQEQPRPILGGRLADRPDPQFPLLVKLLDTQQTLSVQVHPDDRYAQAREGQPLGKAEVWVVLDAEPGAQLIHGVSCPLTRAEAEAAIHSGHLSELVETIDVAAGDVIMNPPGTVHALGEGILLYELQQSSDLTYRLYDWDRNDPARPLHIARSLDVADLRPIERHKTQPVVIQDAGATRTFLCACRAFAAEQITVTDCVVEHPAGACFHIVTVLQGRGTLQYGTPEQQELELHAGESLLVPAGLPEYRLSASAGPLTVIRAWVPDLTQEIVLPLRQRGVTAEAIIQLGGDARHSDLAPHVIGEG